MKEGNLKRRNHPGKGKTMETVKGPVVASGGGWGTGLGVEEVSEGSQNVQLPVTR